MDVKTRLFGAGHRIFTAVGVVAGLLVALGQYLALVPPAYQTSKWYAVAAALVALGAALKMPAKPSASAAPTAPTALALIIGAALLFAAPTRADDTKPAALCAIGSQGNWCYGLLPTVSGPGVDVKNGLLVGGLQVGTSLAATWMPGQLKSVTAGVHTGFNLGSAGAPQTFSLGGTLSLLRGYATVIADWQAVGGNHAFVIMPALGIPL